MTIKNAILFVLDEQEEIKGTETLAHLLNTEKKYILKYARIIEAQGMIQIIPSTPPCGRGHRTVYKRNRNQPGQPRRRS